MSSLLNETIDLRIYYIKQSMHHGNGEGIEDIKLMIDVWQTRLKEALVKHKEKLDLIAALEALKEPEPDALPR